MHLLLELGRVVRRTLRSERAFGAVLFWLVALGGAGIAAGVLWCAHLIAGLV